MAHSAIKMMHMIWTVYLPLTYLIQLLHYTYAQEKIFFPHKQQNMQI